MAEKKNSFEQDLKRLEEIVRTLENSQVGLEDSLTLFEEGTALVRSCTSALDKAEAKISLVTKEKKDD